jgi:hypothetical protein
MTRGHVINESFPRFVRQNSSSHNRLDESNDESYHIMVVYLLPDNVLAG